MINIGEQARIQSWIIPVLLLSLAFCIGCGSKSADLTNQLSLGMTRAEVIQIMGEPDATSAQGSWQTLSYFLSDPSQSWSVWNTDREYQIHLWRGEVQSFGPR